MSATYTPVEKVYQDAKDKRVSAYVLYGDSSKLYVDEEHTTEVEHDDALDACMKGLLVCTAAGTYSAVQKFADSAGTLTVTCEDGSYTVPLA